MRIWGGLHLSVILICSVVLLRLLWVGVRSAEWEMLHWGFWVDVLEL